MRSASAFSNEAEIGLALLGPRVVSEPDDADLLALALGVAHGARRAVCARALLSGERTARRLQEAMAHPLVDEVLGLSPEDRRRRVVEAFLGEAERAARLLAEGLQEGETILAASLAGMCVGWRLASEASDHDAVARFVEALMAELMERGAWEKLGELTEIGHRAADALDRPRLRSRLLAYEGAAWSRRGDYDRAARLWTDRVVLNRRIGNPVGEADALMDLAGDALERGHLALWEDWTAQAETAVERSGRANLAARLWTQRAHERLQAGEIGAASRYAERAVTELSDVSQVDVGLSVRTVAANISARRGETSNALGSLARLLSLAVAEGRPALAAMVLESLGETFLERGDERLSLRCLQSAVTIYRLLGMERAQELAEKIGGDPLPEEAREEPAWDELANAILTIVDSPHLETIVI